MGAEGVLKTSDPICVRADVSWQDGQVSNLSPLTLYTFSFASTMLPCKVWFHHTRAALMHNYRHNDTRIPYQQRGAQSLQLRGVLTKCQLMATAPKNKRISEGTSYAP